MKYHRSALSSLIRLLNAAGSGSAESLLHQGTRESVLPPRNRVDPTVLSFANPIADRLARPRVREETDVIEGPYCVDWRCLP